MLELIKTYNSSDWNNQLNVFKLKHDSIENYYSSKKKMLMKPININSNTYHFSSGLHYSLQKAILEEFAPRFAPDCTCLYVGDSTNRDLIKDEKTLHELGINFSIHNKLPDIVLYIPSKNWLYL